MSILAKLLGLVLLVYLWWAYYYWAWWVRAPRAGGAEILQKPLLRWGLLALALWLLLRSG